MSDRTWQLTGLFFFALSGVFFLVTGIRAGDNLTVLGSLMWLIGCAAWGAPLFRTSAADEH